MEPPLVSVLVVTFNQRVFVEDCVVSAVTQDYPNFEIVVSDDASSDGTSEIVQRLAAEHDNVKAITSDVRLGVTQNCNRALAACDGKYIAFMAGDDGLLQGKLSAQVAWLEQDERRSLCYHDTYMIDDETGTVVGRCSERQPMRAGTGPRHIIRHGPPGVASSVMVRRDALPSGGFDDRLAMVSDWKLMIDCVAGDRLFGFVPGVLGYYRVRADSLTQRSRRDPEMGKLWMADTMNTLAMVLAEDTKNARAAYERRWVIYLETLWGALVARDGAKTWRYVKKALLAASSGASLASLAALLMSRGRRALGELRPKGLHPPRSGEPITMDYIDGSKDV